MNAKFRQWRLMMYGLQRQYSQAIVLCRTSNDTTDFATGVKGATLTQVPVSKAVLLPNRLSSKFSTEAALMSSIKNFKYGGTLEIGVRTILVNNRDIPSSFPIDTNMFLTINGARWEVKGIDFLEETEVIAISAKALSGAPTPGAVPAPQPNTPIIVVPKVSNYQLTGTDSRKIFSTDGASGEVDFTLPTWAQGLQYTFHNEAGFLLRLIASGGASIRLGGLVSSPNGTLDNSTVAATVTLTAISPGEWTGFPATSIWTAT